MHGCSGFKLHSAPLLLLHQRAFEKNHGGWEVAQSVKCLLCEHEELGLSPERWHMLVIPGLGEAELGRVLWLNGQWSGELFRRLWANEKTLAQKSR